MTFAVIAVNEYTRGLVAYPTAGDGGRISASAVLVKAQDFEMVGLNPVVYRDGEACSFSDLEAAAAAEASRA